MRDASPACVAFLNANNVSFRADCVTLTLANGAVYRWTTWDADLSVQCWTFAAANGNARTPTEGALLYKTHSESDPTAAPIVVIGNEDEGGTGLSVATLDITLSGEGFRVGSRTLMVAAADGQLDGAWVRVDHLLMPTPGDTSLQSFVDFEGRVSETDIGVSDVTLRCKSWLESAAATMLPKRTLSPNCTWEFCGVECGLSLDALKTDGTITSVASATTVTATTTAHNAETYVKTVVDFTQTFPLPVEETRGHFDMGALEFKADTATAALRGARVDIVSQDGMGQITLAMPLGTTPAVGDTFWIWPGCRRDFNNCQHFSNAGRFGGFPFVPPNSSTPVR